MARYKYPRLPLPAGVSSVTRDGFRYVYHMEDGYSLHISPSNAKVGKIPNISLPPLKSCSREACKQCGAKCYAQKAYKQYKTTHAAWDNNFALAQHDLPLFEACMVHYLQERTPVFFRIHVSGDFFSVAYAETWVRIAEQCPATSFLAMTKQFYNVIVATARWEKLPCNLSLLRSVWTTPLSDFIANEPCFRGDTYLRESNGNTVAPTGTAVCPGRCDVCKACWNGESVIFDEH